MMEILLATALITLVSLTGVVLFGFKGHLSGTNRYIVPFAIGTFLAVTFLELIPETLSVDEFYGALAIVGGFLSFYLLAHWLGTYHHHHHGHGTDDCTSSRGSAKLLLVGDTVHNFTDGVVVATAFLISPVVGWFTVVGIILHEVPQEIAEFGVLRKAGYTTAQAALRNLISASSVVVGAAITVLLTDEVSGLVYIVTGIAAGNLLYVAMSDLIPDVHESTRTHGGFWRSFLATLVGFALVGGLIIYAHEQFGHGHEYRAGSEEALLDHDEDHDVH